MRKYNYDDNDEFREDIDKFFDENNESPANYDDLLQEEFAIQEARIDVQNRDIDIKMMRTAVRICEKTFLWCFLSVPTRMKMIADAYKKLKKLEE